MQGAKGELSSFAFGLIVALLTLASLFFFVLDSGDKQKQLGEESISKPLDEALLVACTEKCSDCKRLYKGDCEAVWATFRSGNDGTNSCHSDGILPTCS